MNIDWLLGFIEGEGNFTINFSVRRHFIYPKLVFQIGVTEKGVLDKIREFLSSQGIRVNIYPSKAQFHYGGFKKEPRKPRSQFLLQIVKSSSIRKFSELLENLEWYSDKISSFNLWKKALKLAYARPCRKATLIKLAEIAGKINSDIGKRKWTPEFIEKNCIEENDKVRLI